MVRPTAFLMALALFQTVCSSSVPDGFANKHTRCQWFNTDCINLYVCFYLDASGVLYWSLLKNRLCCIFWTLSPASFMMWSGKTSAWKQKHTNRRGNTMTKPHPASALTFPPGDKWVSLFFFLFFFHCCCLQPTETFFISLFAPRLCHRHSLPLASDSSLPFPPRLPVVVQLEV